MSVNVATAIGVKNGTELAFAGEDLLNIRYASAECEVGLRSVDCRRDVRFDDGGQLQFESSCGERRPHSGIAEEFLVLRADDAVDDLRGFFGDPAVHTMIVLTTDTASSAATTMLIAFRTPSPQ